MYSIRQGDQSLLKILAPLKKRYVKRTCGRGPVVVVLRTLGIVAKNRTLLKMEAIVDSLYEAEYPLLLAFSELSTQ